MNCTKAITFPAVMVIYPLYTNTNPMNMEDTNSTVGKNNENIKTVRRRAVFRVLLISTNFLNYTFSLRNTWMILIPDNLS